MDQAGKFKRAHEKISGSLPVYRKLPPGSNLYSVAEYIKDLDEMFREVVLPHFDYEDEELFPEILAHAGQDLTGLLDKFKKEHKEMKEKLEYAKKESGRLWADPVAPQKDKDALVSLCNGIVKELIDHAREEDEKIFPFLHDSP